MFDSNLYFEVNSPLMVCDYVDMHSPSLVCRYTMMNRSVRLVLRTFKNSLENYFTLDFLCYKTLIFIHYIMIILLLFDLT
ncbi:Asparagine--tRNA ligase [Bienertia sinuspersici]